MAPGKGQLPGGRFPVFKSLDRAARALRHSLDIISGFRLERKSLLVGGKKMALWKSRLENKKVLIADGVGNGAAEARPVPG